MMTIILMILIIIDSSVISIMSVLSIIRIISIRSVVVLIVRPPLRVRPTCVLHTSYTHTHHALYIYIYIYICLFRGDHLSNTTCLTRGSFQGCESYSEL